MTPIPLDINSDIVSEVRSFRHEFKKEIEGSNSILDLLILMINSGIMSSVPELATAFAVFATLPVTVARQNILFQSLNYLRHI
jgi:hypothetical protein